MGEVAADAARPVATKKGGRRTESAQEGATRESLPPGYLT